MSNGEWTVLGIFIGVLVGTSVYNTLVLNRLQKTAKWNEVKLANPYKCAFIKLTMKTVSQVLSGERAWNIQHLTMIRKSLRLLAISMITPSY